MIDIVSVVEGQDLGILDTVTERAKNILSVQYGSLTYAPTLGIDLAYFLSEEFEFQNESFKAYLVQVLSNFGINVAEVKETVESLFVQMDFELTASETRDGFIAG